MSGAGQWFCDGNCPACRGDGLRRAEIGRAGIALFCDIQGGRGGVRPSGRGVGLSYCMAVRRGSDTGPLPNRFSDIFILLSFLSQEPAASLQAGPVSVTLYPSDMSDSDIFDIFVSTEQRCGRGPDFRPTGAFGFSSNNFAIFANCLKPARETQ